MRATALFGASWAEGFNAVAMHHAALSGDPNFVRDLLKDPLHKNCLERRDGAGWLPITTPRASACAASSA